MSNVTLNHVYKKYDQINAVKDFHLEIHDQEFLVLVGPSGCGKSTTLRMIAGLEEISSGDLYIDQVRVNDVSPKARDIAMVFQSYALYPHMTVYENMSFGLRLRKYPKTEIDQKVRAAASVLDLEPFLDRKPNALSGGQKQRVALGRAIVRKPKVFLMDEPLSNLDAKLRVQMRTEISRLHKQLGATVIYVTHDQTEALTMGDRIVVMKDGVVQQVGTPVEIYHNPTNRFVASFIGSPAINFIAGQLVTQGKQLYFNAGYISFPIPTGKAKQLLEQSLNGKEITLGIRPEAIYDDLAVIEATPKQTFLAEVEMVEHMGAEYYLYVRVNDQSSLTARVNARHHYQIGDNVKLAIDMNKAHFFDRKSDICLV
ncbi:carbohydrate ABC transporter ATP-binding protein, CUT1 family [Seinonella peptonophila]|uniref:Carbohydrate ABC transporter ATP-binding protein, CUT1 family n=1 Tax=Seinonella peptonophila TaxID=112248 RepID=A0A1M4T409_9BACL|nr:sn-glycerol-3-phosphate ABC transporter ATP-binding protein UgpC [Seinonella peptonophila]SHE39154.1 carbohydrate ABC transporter ATP-binding protein, CUT1 family [Seinonella peptonophila]